MLKLRTPTGNEAKRNRRNKHIAVACIPAYNEQRTIGRVVLQTQKYVDQIIVCDDGSTDTTAEIAERLGADVLRHKRNLGYGAAIQSLFRRARELNSDIIITLDGDGQHNPNEIPILVKPLSKGFDVVIGSRFLSNFEKSNSVPRYRRLGIKVITGLAGAALHHRLSDVQSGFRAYGRDALKNLNFYENGMGVSVEILMEAKKKGLHVGEIPTRCNYHGLPKTTTQRSLRHGVGVIISIMRLKVKENPLIFFGIPSVGLLLAGALFGVLMLQI